MCLYVKLHFKRQVHYLRLGVVILFTLTGARCAVECLRLQGCLCTRASLAGDLEDVVCACVWPVFCWFCQLRVFGARGLKHMPDPALLWSALSVTYLIAVIVAFGAVIVLPELAAELLRIVCADE